MSMDTHNHNEFETGDAGKYTVTTFISFVVMFVFLMLMMQWHGYFKPAAENTRPAVEHAAP